MGRTFQRMQLYTSMTVAENVALGREATLVGANPLRQFLASRLDRAEIGRATEEALGLCDLAGIADAPVATLSVGQRRLVELARAYAGGYPFLLLDEPSSGLDETETQRFGEILHAMRAQRDLGILIIEHDMSLVMSICQRIHVLDFGVLIWEGSPGEIQDSDVVRRAYLGSTPIADLTVT
jgi:ABC-type branched-subunit amino acid transport system ATPase component